MISFRLLLLFTIFLPSIAVAQSVEKADIAINYLQSNYAELGLTNDDVQDLIITDNYTTKRNGFRHIYYAQTYKGHKVENAIFNVTLTPEDEILFSGNRFVADFQSKVSSSTLNVSPEDAIVALANNLGHTSVIAPTRIPNKSNNTHLNWYQQADFSLGEMTSELKYHKISDDEYRLAWEVYLDERGTVDSWYGYIDAATGKILSKRQLSVECKFHVDANETHINHAGHQCSHTHHHSTEASHQNELSSGVDGSAYTVFAFPAESPIHGPYIQVNEPAFPSASPFGWHDEDGIAGPEHTITRGNNIWAYEDRQAGDVSLGNEPDGGADLQFDFPYSPTDTIEQILDASVVNLFYVTNFMHDFTHYMGFDEAAGSYQNNNYFNGGVGNDQIFAESVDGSATNNATWSGGNVDGINGRIQMFGLTFNSSGLFRVLEPANIAGEYTTTYVDPTGAGGGAPWTNVPLPETVNETLEVVVVADNSPQDPQQGCGEIQNDVAGKLAIIFRGSCQFGLKALNAEQAGAAAAIICNVPGVNGGDGQDAQGMAPGDVGDQVTIPTMSLGNADCLRIVSALNNGPVQVEIRAIESNTPDLRSGSFDNGVIAHEYGHGVYRRLIGGPGTFCEGDDMAELQSEGFTDYLSLVTTAEPGDSGADARPVGTWFLDEEVTGRGIRRWPYSTDMSINPITYDDIRLGQGNTHPRGELLTTLLWDIHWMFTDLYGFDPDLTNSDAGNVRGIQLAFDALKAAPCQPTFVDIRDAVLAVDNGEHNCELWDLFARRGIGFFADPQDRGNPDDHIVSFEGRATCIPTLKIQKDITSLVNPGDVMTVTFDIANHTPETATNVVVTDVLDEGLTVLDGPAGISFTQSGNEVFFEIGDMLTLEERTFSYTVQTDPSRVSETLLLNTVEVFDEQNMWDRDLGANNQTNINTWSLNAFDSRSGDRSWFSGEIDQNTDHRLIMSNLSISGNRPVVRFWHRINTEFLRDGGFVEVSTDNAVWLKVDDLLVRGGYNSTLAFGLLAIPNLGGYSGLTQQGDFQDAYLDLSQFNGQDVSIRFRFATQDLDGDGDVDEFPAENGWYIDDFELMDVESYFTSANIAADNADMIETEVLETFINSDFGSATKDLEEEGVSITLFPNPVDNVLNLAVNSDKNRDAKIQLASIDGKLLQERRVEFLQNENQFSIDVSSYQPGLYLVHFLSDNKITTKKVIIE